MEFPEREYQVALQGCQDGKVTEELRKLYNAPYRDQIPWDQFPSWARPNDHTEGCHEG